MYKWLYILFAASLTLVGGAGHADAPLSIAWSQGPNMLQPTAGGMTGMIGDTLILAGGTFWHTMEAKRFLRWTQLYDVQTGIWRMGPDLPRDLAYALSVVVEGKMYTFGGCGQDFTPIANGYILSRVANTEEGKPRFEWSRGPSLPEPAVFTMGAAVGSVIYAVGGSRDYGLTQMSNALYALDTHNLDANWQTLTPMPGPPTSHFAAAACGGNLYVFGGYRTDKEPAYNVDDAYKYDITADTWTRIRRVPFPCRAQTALAYDDRYILIFGPYIASAEDGKVHGSDYGTSAAVFLYDTQEDSYESLQPMPRAVVEIFFVLKNNILYGAGGEQLHKIRSPYLLIGKIGPSAQEE